MDAASIVSTLRGWAAATALVLLAACGGSDGGTSAPAEPPAPPAGQQPNVTAAGAIVTSNDGKVRLIVPPGAVGTPAFISIESTEPDPETAADPGYLQGSSYRIVGSLGPLTVPATWELTLDAPAAAAGRARAASASTPPPSTGYSCNGSGGKPVGLEWVLGNSCPSGCTKSSSITDVNKTTYSICRPSEALFMWDRTLPPCDQTLASGRILVHVPRDDHPEMYDYMYNVWGPPGALCYMANPPSPPALITSVPDALNLMPCTITPTKLTCPMPQVYNGPLFAFADTSPPSSAFLNVPDQHPDSPGPTVTLDPAGNGTMRYVITGADDRKAASAELWEMRIGSTLGPNGLQPLLTPVLVATHDTNSYPDPKLFRTPADPLPSVPFNASDPLDRYFFGRVFDAAGNFKDSKIVKVSRYSPALEVANFTANPASLAPPSGTTTLSWTVANALTVSIDQGIGDVTAQTVNGSGSIAVNVASSRTFTLTATGANSTTATRSVAVTVAPDTAPPVVTLAASPGTVVAPGSTLLTANATDNVGVTQVEFYRGSTLIATDTTPADGFTHGVSFTAADVGNVGFTARAFDAAGNNATSVPITVLVTVPASGDRFVSPSGNDTNPGTQAQPYLTLTKAFAEVGPASTVWLDDGTFTWAAEATAGATAMDFKTRYVPPGRTVRATSPGMATVNFGFTITGDSTLVGLKLTTVQNDGPGLASGGVWLHPSAAAGSALQLKGVTLGIIPGGALGGAEALILNQCPTCTVTMDTNGAADFNYLSGDFAAGAALFNNQGASLTVNGGRFSSPNLARGSASCTASPGIVFLKGRNFTFNDVAVTLPEDASGSYVFCVQGAVTLNNSSVTLQGSGRLRLFTVGAQSPGNLTLNNSTVSAPPSGQLFGLGDPAARLTLTGSTIEGGSQAIGAAPFVTTTLAAQVTLSGSTLKNVNGSAISFGTGVTLQINGSEVKDNQGPAISLNGVQPYNVVLRGTSVSNSAQTQGDAAISLAGDSASSFDLGTAAEPGGNTILSVNTARPGIRVGVNSAVTVNAARNTWVASEQGANGSGQYTGNVLVTSGSGRNYAVTSGALRLSGN